MWKMLSAFSMIVIALLSFPDAEGFSGIEQRGNRGIGGFIHAILGKACWCKCGKANLNVEQYRSLRKNEDANKNRKSEDEEILNITLLSTDEDAMASEYRTTTIAIETVVEEPGTRDNRNYMEVKDKTNEFLENDPFYIGKIHGGDTLPVNGFPWNVLVFVFDTFMGGAIVTDKHIITAAALIYKLGATAADIKVAIAPHDICVDGGLTNVTVANITIHPLYENETGKFDIAILELTDKLIFNDTTSPICLPESHHNVSALRRISWVASWLSPDVGNAINCVPKVTRLPSMSSDECNRANYIPGRISYDKGCLGVYGGISTICEGEVGSPVQFINKHGRFELLGVLTNTNICDEALPAIYTRADQTISWIKETVSSGCFCLD